MKSLSKLLRPSFVLISLLMIHGQLLPMCGSTVLWHNTCSGAGISTDVNNQNIDIIGCNALVQGIQVNALTCDILVTVTNGDALITGSIDGNPPSFPRLYLFAATGHTITFSLAFDLTFCGTRLGNIERDLLVTVSGDGDVIFEIAGGHRVTFTCCDPLSGGTKVYIAMDNPNTPSLEFRRLGGPNAPQQQLDVNVVIGCKSCLGFIAETPIIPTGGNNEEGSVVFDPANTGTGCFFLRIAENSCLIVSGRQVTDLNSEILLSDISLNVPAGGEAQFIVENPFNLLGIPAPLQIVNNNKLLTKFVSDPFCEDAFIGTQFGFILGPNGTMVLNDITYVDYCGTSSNDSYITINTPLANLQPEVRELVEDDELPSLADYIKLRNPSAFIIDGIVDPDTGQTVPPSLPATIEMHGSSALYFKAGADDEGDVIDPINFLVPPIERTFGFGNIMFDVEAPLEVIGDPAGGDNALNILSLEITKTGCPIFVESDPANNQFPRRTFTRDADGEYLAYNLAAWLVNSRINFRNACLLHTDEIHRIFERDNLGRPDISSEPAYIGGETWKYCNPVGRPRPTMAFYRTIDDVNNVAIRFNAKAGFTGVDLRFPNDPDPDNLLGNQTIIRFYGNGRCIDEGYGRYVILGTNDGGFSSGGFFINNDTHLDIFQEVAGAATPQLLTLDVGSNNTCVVEGINCNISEQFSVQTFWLGNNSNISIGTNADVGTDIDGTPFVLTTTPTLFIDGDFYSFETHGGPLALPETSGTTGEGGIFVDKQGVFFIDSLKRASISTMVVRSRNGVIDLPKRQVFFDHRIGLTHWRVDLTDPAQRVLIPVDQNLSQFTMDWGDVRKDYCICGSGFVPYEPPNTPFPCECPPVTNDNLVALPVVQGQVDEFQIKRSRIGDQMHLMVDGGFIRETIFLTGYNTAEAPVGFIVVQNDGRVGLGTNHTTIDSLQASIVMGINGVQVCANGTGVIEVNEDIVIENVCHILTGTAFGINGPQTLEFHSHEPKTLRVKSTGLLDLTSFNTANKILRFGGQLRLLFEPGARVVFGGGTYIFAGQAAITGERVLDNDLIAGTDPSELDPVRVKFIGSGTILMQDTANWLIPNDSFFGIETDISCTTITNLTVVLSDDAILQVGTADDPGGVLQIGNTFQDPDATITFSLVLNGLGTQFQIGQQGFFGMGVGMVNRTSPIPNQWTVGCLASVNLVAINILQGTMTHDRIVTGDSQLASLLAIGPSNAYTFHFTTQNLPAATSVIQAGGNLVLISNCLDESVEKQSVAEQQILVEKAQDFVTNLLTSNKEKITVPIDQVRPLLMALLNSFINSRGLDEDVLLRQGAEMLSQMEESASTRSRRRPRQPVRPKDIIKELKQNIERAVTRAPIGVTLQPIVRNFAGVVSANLSTNIMSSKPLLGDKSPAQADNVTPAALFAYLSTIDHGLQDSPKSNVAQVQLNTPTFGYIVNTTQIRRQIFFRIVSGTSADYVAPFLTFSYGAAFINLNNFTQDITRAIQLQAA